MMPIKVSPLEGHMSPDLVALADRVRARLAQGARASAATGHRLLADILDEDDRHSTIVTVLEGRVDNYERVADSVPASLVDRALPPDVDRRAATPNRGGLPITDAQRA